NSNRVYIRDGENGYTLAENNKCVQYGSHIVLVDHNGEQTTLTIRGDNAGAGYCWEVTPPIILTRQTRVKTSDVYGLKGIERLKKTLEVYTIDPNTDKKTKLEVKFYDSVDAARKAISEESNRK